jgi:hypothetical protein
LTRAAPQEKKKKKNSKSHNFLSCHPPSSLYHIDLLVFWNTTRGEGSSIPGVREMAVDPLPLFISRREKRKTLECVNEPLDCIQEK